MNDEQIKQFAAEIVQKVTAKERKTGIHTNLSESLRQMIIHKLSKEGWSKKEH